MSVGDDPVLIHAMLDVISVKLEVDFQDPHVTTAVVGDTFEKPLLRFGCFCMRFGCLVCVCPGWFIGYKLVVRVSEKEAFDVGKLVGVSLGRLKVCLPQGFGIMMVTCG